MTKRIGGLRRKTRHKLAKSLRQKGKISLTTYFQTFEVGERVALRAEPAVQKGMYHPNYYGKAGIVKGKKGRCYEITIKDRTKEKILIVHPVHIKKISD